MTLHMRTAAMRADFFFQVPAVQLHPSVLEAVGVPEFTLVRLRTDRGGNAILAWAITSDEGAWNTCESPWHQTVWLSAGAWRDLTPGDDSRIDQRVSVTFPLARLPVRPARLERLMAGDQLGLHADDAAAYGIEELAFVNFRGIPGLFRVVKSTDDRDKGIVRLSYPGRMLLGIPVRSGGLLPELLFGPMPRPGRNRLALVGEPHWEEDRQFGLFGRLGTLTEALATVVLRAPEVAFRTVDALPGEDHERTVRLAADLFPLLGTQPGKQVYISWGAKNRVVATALAMEPMSTDPRRGKWAQTDVVGARVPAARAIPLFARLRISAELRAALGVPRTAVVTVRRRVTSLILSRLNELILPVTGLFIALSVDAKMKVWTVLAAVIIILTLLLAPLRIRRNPRGRVR